jgi:YidC/Oxa1 family membrane protein insertase
LIATNNIKTNKEERDKYEAKRADSEARFHRDFDLAKENNKTAKIEEEALLVYTENFMKEKSRLAMAMREANKGNPQKMNQEMMALYKKEKINPLGGCLPMLIQIPVFISLYWVLLSSVEIRNAPWILWIHDLAVPDPYYILPVIMAVSMYVQTKLNPGVVFRGRQHRKIKSAGGGE